MLLGVWLYGFMSGVRSVRQLEQACRDQVPYLWLTGWQRPDHNTLWRCSEQHRQGMRKLVKRTVRVAMKSGLVDLAVQAVDGTRVAGLAHLLERTEAAITDLEAQNRGGAEPPPLPHLPEALTQATTPREQIQEALARVQAEDGPARTNLTDADATLQKTRNGGFVVGYTPPAMVAGVAAVEPGGPGGLLITAADVTTDRDDHGQLVPLLDQAVELTAAPIPELLADGGYHSTANLVACAARRQGVLMPDPQAPRPSQPYHKDRVVSDPETDTYTCPRGQTLTFHGMVARGTGKPPDRKDRASKTACDAGPVRDHCTTSKTKGRAIAISPNDAQLRAHRTRMATDDATPSYRRRTTLPEPAFGMLKEQQAARRFHLRGLENVRAEWALLATAFNLRTLTRLWRVSQQRSRLATAA